MFNRWIEEGLLDVLAEQNMGCIVFSPLAQGLLTGRYLDGIPQDSRAAKLHGFLRPDRVTEDRLVQVRKLSEIARARGQTMAQLALAWNLRHAVMTSVLVGASKVSQIEDNVGALQNLDFSVDELAAIESILAR
jgi:L-glyceraldehyde 3-phosphate reductase